MTRQFFLKPNLEEMPTTADVVVIGGGPAGASAVWALHRADPTLNLVLLEQSERLGAGSSTASLENYRTCWVPHCIAQQMQLSIQVFHNADVYLGEGAGEALHLKQQGYLFCGFTESHAEALRADVDYLHRHNGLTHVEYLSAEAVRTRFPWLGERVIAAKYDPIAGWLDSNALIHRYVRSAPSARVLLGIGDSQIRVEQAQVVGVETNHGFIACPKVIIACGANARQMGLTAGVDLPVVVRPRQSFTTTWRHPEFPPDGPMLIGSAPFPHVRPEAREGAIFGWEYQWHSKRALSHLAKHVDVLIEPQEPLAPLKDPRFPSLVLLLLARQFGHAPGTGFNHPRYLQGISHNIGYYVSRSQVAAYRVEADGHHHPYESERAIIDAVPDVAGLFVSIAHVGHGIMTSPAAGQIIAAHVLGRPLPHERFVDFGLRVNWVPFDENSL